MYQLRAMQERDIPAVLAIQEQSYAAEVLEDEAVIRSRLATFPQLAWVAEDDEGVCAYLFAYHSRLGKVTPLDGEFCTDGEADCLYLHDLAVAGRAAGRGIGPALVRHNLQQAGAAQLRYSALVSGAGFHRFLVASGLRSPRRTRPAAGRQPGQLPDPCRVHGARPAPVRRTHLTRPGQAH